MEKRNVLNESLSESMNIMTTADDDVSNSFASSDAAPLPDQVLQDAQQFLEHSGMHTPPPSNSEPSYALRTPSMSSLVRALPLKSVVKVYSSITEASFLSPWKTNTSYEVSGSGFVIETWPNYIITNAHVINNASYISVRPYGAKRYPAVVVKMASECDLAILRIVDEEQEAFFGCVEMLSVGGLPHLQDEVIVLGYPTGGDSISITKGVVSRIERILYSQGLFTKLLSVQTDAAINPGNSGGPVINANLELVGVAFQGLSSADGIGYIIPTEILLHFLADVEMCIKEGKPYSSRGFVALGVATQRVESPHMKSYLKLPAHLSGILVTSVNKTGPADGILQKDDVLLEINSKKIQEDGSIPFRETERIHYAYEASRFFTGDDLTLKVWRSDQIKELTLQLKPVMPLVSPYRITSPSYVLFGGMLFVPLSWALLEDLMGTNRADKRDLGLVTLAEQATREIDDEEIVVLARILADIVNRGYQDIRSEIVDKVDEVDVKTLKQLHDYLLSTEKEFVRVHLKRGESVVLRVADARESNERIRTRHMIAQDAHFHLDC